MSNVGFIGTLIYGSAIWLLPIIIPLFFFSNGQRRVLFYFVGLSCSFLCYKVAPVLWAFFTVLIGQLLASLRHEDFSKGVEYGFAIGVPGLEEGYGFLGILPMLILGTLLSVIVLRKLKSSLFKPPVGGGST